MTDITTLIHRYFDLASQADMQPHFAQFTDDATVEDEGVQRKGIDAIRAWRTEVPPVAYTVHDIVTAGPGHDAHIDIAGGEGPHQLARHLLELAGRTPVPMQLAVLLQSEEGEDHGHDGEAAMAIRTSDGCRRNRPPASSPSPSSSSPSSSSMVGQAGPAKTGSGSTTSGSAPERPDPA